VAPAFDRFGTPGSMTLGQTEVSTTDGSTATVPFTFGFTDAPLGISHYLFEWVDINPPAGAVWTNGPNNPAAVSGSGTVCATSCVQSDGTSDHMVSGTVQDGIFQGHVSIPPSLPSGTYRLDYVEIDDPNGLYADYGDSQSPAGFTSVASQLGNPVGSLDFTLSSNGEPPATNGPVLSSSSDGGQLALSANQINSSTSDQNVVVTIGGLVADAGYRICGLLATFSDGKGHFLNTVPTGSAAVATSLGNPMPDPASLLLWIPQYADQGTWVIQTIWLAECTNDGAIVRSNGFSPSDLGFSPSQYTFTNSN